MAVTVSLNIDYCASYLASLFQLGSDQNAAQSYGVYVAGVAITAVLLAIPYFWLLRAKAVQQDRSKLTIPSYVFFVCFLIMFLVNLALLLTAVFHSTDIKPDNWLWQQVLYNRSMPIGSPDVVDPESDAHECSSNQTVIGYIPALFYSNMFSLVYLQIKAKTKISAEKAEKDLIIGYWVVFTIFITAFVFYAVFLIGTLTTSEEYP